MLLLREETGFSAWRLIEVSVPKLDVSHYLL